MEDAYEGVPYIMFGHSMGSFITRVYISQYGWGLSAAILCGTGNQPWIVSAAGRALALMMCRIRGPRFRSRLLDSLGAGAFSKGIENERTPFDWLSTDPLVVDAYLADEMCGEMFSVSAYAALLDLTEEAVTAECAASVPNGLPLLFVAGAQDPVGDFGKGVIAAADLAEEGGSHDVTVVLYEGMRHEILNEPGKTAVYENVVEWLDDCLGL